MSNIEFVMEVGCSLSEVSFDLGMEGKSCFNDLWDLFLDSSLELSKVLVQVSRIDG
jgi:hypothetical protein